MALPPLNQVLIRQLEIASGRLPNSDGIVARYVERQGADGIVQKIAIGYFKDSSWMNRSWAFAPFANGDVPSMEGSELDSWVSTWRRDHQHADYKRSGDEGQYLCSRDVNDKKYVLIPANGQNGFVGYVPARLVTESLNNGYLTDPHDYLLVADRKKVLHLACRGVPYADHGFTLHGKVWWPIKNPPYAEWTVRVEAIVARIENKVRQHFPIPQIQLGNLPQNAAVDGMAMQHLPQVNNIDQLTPVERFRLFQFNNAIRDAVNAKEDLEQNQKEALINELVARTTLAAFQRHFYREGPNIALRGINILNTPSETLCETFVKGGVWFSGGYAFLHEPVITGIVFGTIYLSSKCFDDECFLNQFFQWMGCAKKPITAAPAAIPPLVVVPLNNNQ